MLLLFINRRKEESKRAELKFHTHIDVLKILVLLNRLIVNCSLELVIAVLYLLVNVF